MLHPLDPPGNRTPPDGSRQAPALSLVAAADDSAAAVSALPVVLGAVPAAAGVGVGVAHCVSQMAVQCLRVRQCVAHCCLML